MAVGPRRFGYNWTEGHWVRIVSLADLTEAQLSQALSRIEARDPLITPLNPEVLVNGNGIAALDVHGDVLGIGWLRHRQDAVEIDIRVEPAHRRTGIGSALFNALDEPTENLVASCDSAQRNAIQFLEEREFQLRSVLFARRWDGDEEDVPPAFQTAHVEDAVDRNLSWSVLNDAMADSWPGPSIDEEQFLSAGVRVRNASIDGRLVGVLVATESEESWSLGGFGVLKDWRARGVGRSLLCEQMRLCAAGKKGLVLHVAHDNESFLDWTRNLGFWTFRSWAILERTPAQATGTPV